MGSDETRQAELDAWAESLGPCRYDVIGKRGRAYYKAIGVVCPADLDPSDPDCEQGV